MKLVFFFVVLTTCTTFCHLSISSNIKSIQCVGHGVQYKSYFFINIFLTFHECWTIICDNMNYICELLRRFVVPKFIMYDKMSDPFDHIMHFRQLMTLNIGHNALMCKVFLASLHGQALSWFYHLPHNSMNIF